MHFEIEILKYIWNLHNPSLDIFMTWTTYLGNLGIVWIFLCLLMAYKRENRQVALEMAIALLLSVLIGSLFIKPFAGRHRPSWIHETDLLISNPKDYSFPSGHTYSGFAVSTSLFFHKRIWGICSYSLASLIAFSRLYHFVHYPTDILGGILLGILCAFLSRILTRKIIYPKIQRYWKRKGLK